MGYKRPLVCWLVLMLGFGVFFLGEHQDMQKARAALAPSGLWSTLAAYAATTSNAWSNPPACLIEGRKAFAATDALNEAFVLSMRNALVINVGSTDSTRRTLGCLFGPDGEQQIVPARVAKASTVQSLLSGLLIFLFALAVRNLLRLK